MKKYVLALVAAFFVAGSVAGTQESSSNLLAQELSSMLENDADIKMRMEIEDQAIASFFDWVEKSKVIAQQDSSLGHAFDYFFFNVFPGASFQAMFEGLVYVSHDKAPRINAIVMELCQKYQMPVPPIFLAGNQKLFKACVSSFSANTAMLILGKKMVDDLSDDQLKAVLAHELSHIKNNHAPKMMILVKVPLAAVTAYYFYAYTWPNIKRYFNKGWDRWKQDLFVMATITAITILMVKICSEVSRMHEKEADLDALKIIEDPETFVAAMEKIKEYYEKELEKVTEQSECLHKKIEELAQVSPGVAAYIKFQVDLYINAKITNLQDALKEENGSHPSIQTRIGYGKEAMRQQSTS